MRVTVQSILLISALAIIIIVILVNTPTQVPVVQISPKLRSHHEGDSWYTDEYIPSKIEDYFLENADRLGYNVSDPFPSGCDIWHDQESEIYNSLMAYYEGFQNHSAAIQNFEPIPDLLKSIIANGGTHDVCETARPHPEGLQALFPRNDELSLLSMTGSGLVEPLFPPMRSPDFCFQNRRRTLVYLNYLVHDFEAMCLKLKPHSKRVLIDLGASLSFFDDGSRNPMVEFLGLYEKFGFNFDHIYAFEYTFTEPGKVYKEILPQKYFKSYHWINVGIESDEASRMNPLETILKEFDEDDFIVLKLDIDTHSVEYPLAKQLLEDKDGIYHKLIDQFYFEHHVNIDEMSQFWGGSMIGTVKESLELFRGLREKGIPAHFWV